MIFVHPSTAANFPLSKLITDYSDLGYVLWFMQAPSGKRYLCLRPHSSLTSANYAPRLERNRKAYIQWAKRTHLWFPDQRCTWQFESFRLIQFRISQLERSGVISRNRTWQGVQERLWKDVKPLK